MKNSYRVGFDLGGTKMLAGVFDAKYKRLGTIKMPTEGHRGKTKGVKRIIETIEAAVETTGIKASQIKSIGVGCPGSVDLKKGIITNAPNLGWKNTKLKDALESHFKCGAIIANDVDAGVYGEFRFGAGKQSDSVVGIFPGTGIGGGAVLNGNLVEGSRHTCMEIGHMQMVADGPLCGCGQRGCLEALASRLAISSAVAAAAYRGLAPTVIREVGTDFTKIKSGLISRSVEAGDTAVEDIVRNAARWLGIGVANMVHLLAPDTIILGGGLVEAMKDLYVEEVSTTAKSHVMSAYEKSFKVKAATLGDYAGLMGAAAWAEKRLGK